MAKQSSRKDRDGLYKRKLSSYWWASFTDARGKRTRKSTGTADRKEAEAILARWKLDAHRQTHWGVQQERYFDELMLLYLRTMTPRKRAAERDIMSAARLAEYFTGRGMSTIDTASITAYIEVRYMDGVAPGTINKELGLLSSAIGWANKELGWELKNPVQGRRQTEPPGRIRWITKAESRVLLKSAKDSKKAPHLAPFIQLALHTGMRKGEMLGLEWSRVDFQQNLIYLEAQHQKNGKFGSVPLNSSARQALLIRKNFCAKNCPDSRWVFCGSEGERIKNIKRSFSTACKNAGIENFRPHDLRHTFASWLVQKGVGIREVAELLRHSDIRVTMRYAHLAPHNLQSAVQLLEDKEINTPSSQISHSTIFGRVKNESN